MFVDARCLCRTTTDVLNGPRDERLAILPSEEPMRRTRHAPVVPEHDEEVRGNRYHAIPVSLGLTQVERASLAINVGDSDPHHLGDPQPTGIESHQDGAVLLVIGCIEQRAHLGAIEDDGDPPLLLAERNVLDHPIAPERNPVEEPQRAH